MKFFKRIILATLAAILIHGTASAAPITLRGIVEGFYGTTWSFDDRADMINFCRRHNLNAYIYAPKDDPYHREKWREPYPAQKIDELKKLVELSKQNGVRFIFAVSPGLDLHYSGRKGDADFELMMKKLDSMYQVGVRDFAIFFDDLKDSKGNHHENGTQHANFLNKVQAELKNNHKDVAPLMTVPTEYFRLDMIRGKKLNDYTENFSKTLDKKILVLYTGDGVVCDGISEENFSAACKIYERELGIWWNYPANDYLSAKLALGAVEKLPATNVQAIFFNPMNAAQLSKIALATGADYANSPNNYDAEKSWNRAIEEQFGELAPDMKIFASHSRHMENSWAKVGSPDGERFNTLAYLAINSTKNGRDYDFAALEKLIDEMENSADNLLKNLPQKILSECKPQLEQFKKIAQADRLAVKSLREKNLDPKLKILREEIKSAEPKAILSELSALKFIDDVINFF